MGVEQVEDVVEGVGTEEEAEAEAEDDLAAGEVTDGVADLSIPSDDDRGKE